MMLSGSRATTSLARLACVGVGQTAVAVVPSQRAREASFAELVVGKDIQRIGTGEVAVRVQPLSLYISWMRT